MRRRLELLLCGAVGILASIWLGQDANWDLKNYHLYNPFALLEGRLALDFVPAAFQGYFNPLGDIPYYLVATKLLPDYPRVVAGLQGLHYAALVYFVLRLNQVLLSGALAYVATAIGVTGVVAVSEIGTTFNDIPVAALIVAALFMILRDISGTGLRLGIAGVLLGIATGLKLYGAYYAVAMVAAVVLVQPRKGAQQALWIGAGAAIGFAASFGWWAAYLWSATGNPVFPYFNSIFRSELFSVTENAGFPKASLTWLEWLVLPLNWLHKQSSQETTLPFRDGRMFAGYVAACVLAIAAVTTTWRRTTCASEDTRRTTALLWFAAIGYGFWLTQFRALRFLIPLEALTGTLIGLALMCLTPPAWRVGRYMATGVAVALFAILSASASYKDYDWGRAAYGQRVLTSDAPQLPPNSMVIILGQPLAYVILLLDAPGLTAVGITWLNIGPTVSREGARRLLDHTGAKFVLIGDDSENSRRLNKGIDLSWSQCRPITTSVDAKIALCVATATATE